MQYFVVKNIETGEYFRGKGVNKRGKHFNQASIYRFKSRAEETVEEENRRGARCKVVQIIVEEVGEV